MNRPIYINELKIENFKNFSSLNFLNLARINLITGKNNAGKTSLLEALYLCLGPANPGLLISILSRRGMLISSSSANYFFHDLNLSKKIKFEYKTGKINENLLKIERVENKTFSVSQSSNTNNISTPQPNDFNESKNLRQIYSHNNKKPIVTNATFLTNQVTFSGERQEIFLDSVFLSSTLNANISEFDVPRYSELDRLNRIPEFVEYLKIFEPKLIRTSLLSENNNTFIAGDIGYGLVPLSLLGEGINKFATTVLAISHAKDAICLIDEIENGFHYSMYPKLWESINNISLKNNCQIFCTTHSLECIQGSYGIFGSLNDSDFILHRLEKKGSSNSITTYTQNELKNAIETDWEVR